MQPNENDKNQTLVSNNQQNQTLISNIQQQNQSLNLNVQSRNQNLTLLQVILKVFNYPIFSNKSIIDFIENLKNTFKNLN